MRWKGPKATETILCTIGLGAEGTEIIFILHCKQCASYKLKAYN